MTRTLILTSLVALLLTDPAPALAAAPTAEDRAKSAEWYELGMSAAKRKKWGQAAMAFDAAYETNPDPVLLYNAARAHHRHGDLAKARERYRRLESEGGLDAKVAKKVSKHLADVEAGLGVAAEEDVPPVPLQAPLFVHTSEAGSSYNVSVHDGATVTHTCEAPVTVDQPCELKVYAGTATVRVSGSVNKADRFRLTRLGADIELQDRNLAAMISTFAGLGVSVIGLVVLGLNDSAGEFWTITGVVVWQAGAVVTAVSMPIWLSNAEIDVGRYESPEPPEPQTDEEPQARWGGLSVTPLRDGVALGTGMVF